VDKTARSLQSRKAGQDVDAQLTPEPKTIFNSPVSVNRRLGYGLLAYREQSTHVEAKGQFADFGVLRIESGRA